MDWRRLLDILGWYDPVRIWVAVRPDGTPKAGFSSPERAEAATELDTYYELMVDGPEFGVTILHKRQVVSCKDVDKSGGS